MQFGIVGTSIWQQNMPLLERLTIPRESQTQLLEELKSKLGLDELVYLSTCNRVEFMYVAAGDQPDGRLLHRLIDFFFAGRQDVGFFPNDFYHFSAREAITHLFRTVSSLESLVVGETQITGQFKQAFQEASERGHVGPMMADLADEALLVAKRVKRDTSLGVGALSMASLAANELQAHLEGKSTPLIALVGSGLMTRKLAKNVQDAGLGRLLFVNRTLEKARALADEFGGGAVSLDDFRAHPAEVDAIISATAAPDPVFDAHFLAALPHLIKPVLCVDLAIPRDFSSDFDHDPRVLLVDIPVLKSRGNGNLRQKFVEATKANEIVTEAVAKYLSDRMEVSLKPIFHDSYRESIELANRALNDLFAQKLSGLEVHEREAVTRLVTKLIGHSSFQPVRLLSQRLAQTQSGLCLNEPGGVQ